MELAGENHLHALFFFFFMSLSVDDNRFSCLIKTGTLFICVSDNLVKVNRKATC